MGESIATQFLRTDLEISCTECGYPIWIRYSEVVAQATVTCPCCFIQLRLVDDTGSAQNTGKVIDRKITRALKGLSR